MLTFSVYGRAEDGLTSYHTLPFHIDSVKERMVAVDMNGDGLTDFLVSSEASLSLFLQKSSQPFFNFSAADAILELPGAAPVGTLITPWER